MARRPINHRKSYIEENQLSNIKEIVLDISKKLSNIDTIERIVASAKIESAHPEGLYWDPISIVYGYASLALFFGHMDRIYPNDGWDVVSHSYIYAAVSAFNTNSYIVKGVGLFGGLAGFCFTINYLSRNGSRYIKLHNTLNDYLITQVSSWIIKRSDQTSDVRFDDYDVISGPSGIGAYLLQLSEDPKAFQLVNLIIDRLIFLCQEKNGHDSLFIPPKNLPTDDHRKLSPLGSTDCGFAHGTPGVLAFLSLCKIKGFERKGLDESIHGLSKWLLDNKIIDQWGINWPYIVSPISEKPNGLPTRAAWCYGSPGISRALWLAGSALGDLSLKEAGTKALITVFSRPIEMRLIPSPNLCHGVGGLLQITYRFAKDTARKVFIDNLRCLVHQVVAMYEPNSLVGFRNIEPGGNKVNDIGILNGATGVGLALMSVISDVDPEWDRLFLLT